MLVYDNRAFWRLILARWGSIAWRPDVFVMGIFLAILSFVLQILREQQTIELFDHHYGILAIGGIVGFAVVFRTNLGWQRYWESCAQLHFMYSKWTDAYTQVTAFAQVTIEMNADKGPAAEAKVARVETALLELEADFSLVSALAAHRLSHGDTEQIAYRVEQGARWGEQVLMRHELRARCDAEASSLPGFISWENAPEGGKTEQEMDHAWDTKYLVKLVPSQRKLDALQKSNDRVNMAMYWVVHGLARLSKDIDIAPPIQSRMYQELANGMLGFNNAIKIADIPFPFPYSQLLTLMLMVFSFMIPFYMTAFTKSYVMAPLASFFFFEGVFGLNQVAIELENPFGPDVNDISLEDFHARFIQGLQEFHMAHEVVKGESRDEKAKAIKQAPVDVPKAAPPAAPAPAQNFAAMTASFDGHMDQMCESLDRHLDQIAEQLQAICVLRNGTWSRPTLPTPNSILPTQPNGIPEALLFPTGKAGMQKGPI